MWAVAHLKERINPLLRLLAVVPLVMACAAGPRPRAEGPPRLKDSAPERIAAQRAAVPGLQLEGDDQRWGIEAAREQRREANLKKASANTTPLPRPGQSGPADLHRTGSPVKR